MADPPRKINLADIHGPIPGGLAADKAALFANLGAAAQTVPEGEDLASYRAGIAYALAALGLTDLLDAAILAGGTNLAALGDALMGSQVTASNDEKFGLLASFGDISDDPRAEAVGALAVGVVNPGEFWAQDVLGHLTGAGFEGGVGLIQGEIYAHEMTASSTSGADPIFAETASNQRMIVAWGLDSVADEYVQATIGLPKRYNNGTLTFQFHWTQATTNATATVTWCVEALATGNGDAINAAWGTAQRVVDDGGTAQTHYISGPTPALTAAGTHAFGDTLRLRFSRDTDGNGTAANDDLAQDAQLERITYWFTSIESTDA